ncbi:MAG: hypothetical protein HOO86_05755 [Bacteroidales bacterium]|nr:hypothetical protein [Bacteroidales bacterium]
MANLDSLFKQFDNELNITKTKKDALMRSKNNLRDEIRDHFSENHPKYNPVFFIQGSYKLKTLIRTKDDTCDLDDGVYFKDNPDDVSGTTLQRWIKEAVDGTTDATPEHKKKCIRVVYKAGYNIDLPVLVFNEGTEAHPNLAVKNANFQLDDPKEFVLEFRRVKTDQMVRMVKYLKSWCDFKRQDMPSGLAMTVLTMNHFQSNNRDDIALKFLLIEIEKELKKAFKCVMPTTPKDDLFEEYSDTKKTNFLDNLSKFIEDAKKAIDEKNKLKASKLWKNHLGDRFPEGKDEDEESSSSAKLISTIGASRPYSKFDS